MRGTRRACRIKSAAGRVDEAGMADGSLPAFSLTPDEERFFVRFLRRRALPWSLAAGVLAGALTAGVLTCQMSPPPAAPHMEVELEEDAMPAPLADEQARAELASLRQELQALRARSAEPDAAEPDEARLAELRRALDGLKRELQTIATSVTELQRRAPGSSPAAPDAAATGDLEPLRRRVLGVEERQDREEEARLEWAGNVEQRVRNLELARRSQAEDPASLQRLADRLERVEQVLGTHP
jgi:hypothetical protein